MKKIALVFSFISCINFVFAQRVQRVTVGGNGAQLNFGLLLPQNVVVNIDQNGTLGEWGVDRYADRQMNNSTQRRLDKFEGRTDNYKPTEDSAFQGKLKMIGSALITYYASTDKPHLIGKIKSIGSVKFDYYSNYDDPMSQGRLKLIGSNNITYYGSFENNAIKGKVKSIGGTAFTYFGPLEDKAIAGKIKSMGSSNFTYYDSREKTYGPGNIKSGSYFQNLGGLLYFIKNY
jgi:hypothetical protein